MAGAPGERLFLLDGFALAYRAFYALIGRPLRTTHGEDTSVPWGFTRFLRKILTEEDPAYLAVVFDAPGPSFRRRLYPAYKATRDKLGGGELDDFSASIGRVREILAALAVPVLELPGFEADDVIGTLAVKAAARGITAVIVSGDTDFYQLLGPGIEIYEPGRRGRAFIEPRWIDAAAASERLGAPVDRARDYLALVGDPSDNVPGVRGIGPRTAASLLERFGGLDEILARVDEVEPRRAREAIGAHADLARLSRELVTICTDAPVELDLEALARREPDSARTRDLFLELEFHTLLPEMAPERVEPGRYQPLAAGDAERIASEARAAGRLAIEVTAPARRRAPAWIAVALEPGRAYHLPGDAAGLIAGVLADPGVEVVGHDLKAALLSLRAAGVEVGARLTDTMLAAYCLDPTRRGYDLETLVVDRLGHRLGEAGAGARAAAERADLALRLADRLLAELDHLGQRRLFDELETPLLPVLAELEWAGIRVDTGVLDEIGRRLEGELARVRAQLRELAGGDLDLNLDSPVQLREVLFDRLELPVIKRIKTGPSTDAEVLAELASRGHPFPARLLEYRELAKLASTYVFGLRELVEPRTSRLHTSLNQTVTATGRLSSSEPNLQNIPVRTALGASLRRAFVADPGWLLLEADYSQIELRVLAHLARDPGFIAAFRAGRDVHQETAARIFGVPPARVGRRMRDTAKMVNYATIYGQGAPSLARRLGTSEEEARRFIGDYFDRMPAIRGYLDRQVARAESEGYVETIAGRRRYVPELRSRNPRIRNVGRRVALNTPIQGSAADILKRAMIRIHDRLARDGHEARMVLTVHDELLFEVPERELEAVRRVVETEMAQAASLEVPLAVDFGVGRSWYDAGRERAPEAREMEELAPRL